jgi:hypothetical protein
LSPGLSFEVVIEGVDCPRRTVGSFPSLPQAAEAAEEATAGLRRPLSVHILPVLNTAALVGG